MLRIYTSNRLRLRLRDEIACLKETLKLDNVSLSWVDKKVQVADVLTKAVASSALLLNILNKGRFNTIQITKLIY